MARKATPLFDDSLPVGGTGRTATPAPAPKQTREERLEELRTQREKRLADTVAAREASKPKEDPGAGNTWVYSATDGAWKKMKTSVPGGAGGGAGGGGGGANVGGGFDMAAFLRQQADRDKALAEQTAKDKMNQQKEARQSAYELLRQQFAQYGLESLVTPLQSLIESGISPAEFTIRLRETDAYKKRFAANQARINKGLRALSEAEYINLEDQYQDTMRRYGLPPAYYARGDMGRQEGFEKFIGGDVSPTELEDRIQTAQRRVINANPEVAASLRSFYPEIGQGDLLAYFLDPDKAVENIRRKVTAAEIGGAATMAGLTTGVTRAEELARYGVTGEAARQGFQTVAEVTPRGGQLAEIYKQTPYTQATAEAEVFGLGGAVEAGRQRRKLTELERASFSGTSGAAAGALARDRAGAF